MSILKKMTGYEVEHIPDISFRVMSFFLAVRDIFFPVNKCLAKFNIEKGSTIVDFGCGPGSYIEEASRLVGNKGKVYAVDVHPLAIESVRKRIERNKLENVIPLLSTGYPVNMESHSADVIYALDMFHHVKDTQSFLGELHRILKPGGKLFLGSGHQSMGEARQKIEKSNCWLIVREKRNLFTCMPQHNG